MTVLKNENIIKELNFEKMGGLIPTIIQNANTKAILMLGFVNKEALQKTIKSGRVTLFSRTRKELWTKGETSGNFLFVKEIFTDCDKDSLLIKAEPAGNTCHTGRSSCFHDKIT